MSALHERPVNPWPTSEDKRRATDATRGDNAKIAILEESIRRFQRDFPHSSWPSTPPVVAPLDRNGQVVGLDCEVLTNRFPTMRSMESWGRGKVVGIGDAGLPGRVTLKVRPHGSNYVEGFGADQLTVHAFDDHAWLMAEERAAKIMASRNIDLALCLWGYFHFNTFQREAAKAYAAALSPDTGSREG